MESLSLLPPALVKLGYRTIRKLSVVVVVHTFRTLGGLGTVRHDCIHLFGRNSLDHFELLKKCHEGTLQRATSPCETFERES